MCALGHIQGDHAEQARGMVVVLDVLRAFTVAYVFADGVRTLWLVRTIDEALTLRKRMPDVLLIGEVGGRLISGFDLNNSPARMAEADVRGRALIQRTGAGTQGAVRAHNAHRLLVCSLVNAQATAAYARRNAQVAGDVVTLLPTAFFEGISPYEMNEDDICADYVEALLRDRTDAALLDASLTRLRASGRFAQHEQDSADFPPPTFPPYWRWIASPSPWLARTSASRGSST